MRKTVTLINPNLITQIDDNLGSGIPYLPLTPAYLAACLHDNYNVQVIDAFGEKPFQVNRYDKFLIQGLALEEIKDKILPHSDCLIIYFSTIMANFVIVELIKMLKKDFPDKPLVIVENSQAVIGCSLKYILSDLFKVGVDYIVTGECEVRIPKLLEIILSGKPYVFDKLDGVAYKNDAGETFLNSQESYISNLDNLPFPAWGYFPLENYWQLGYAHGPMEGKYLAIMTSRGCPFSCNFCVIPSTNGQKWRSRSPQNVVSEIEYMIETLGIHEFHLEDVNPTASEKRIVEICKLIIGKSLKIHWKLASGSKIETMRKDTVELMQQAGCNYISFSPESGSSRILKLMNKPFNHAYALDMVTHMHELTIKSQACFVLGYPGEEVKDLQATQSYVKSLAKAGIDEIALFIMTPIPGTKTYGQLSGYSDYSELTFSPKWRNDFVYLNSFRKQLYIKFLLWKLIYHPVKVFEQGLNLFKCSFLTKVEMNVYRAIKVKYLTWKGNLQC